MVSKVLTAQEGPSGQNGAEEPEEGRMTRRASSRQKVTKHSTEEQGMPRKPLSCRRVNRRRSIGHQESSNGQENADLPGRCRSARCAPDGHESVGLVMVMSGQRSVEQSEGRRLARRMPVRQEIAESQQGKKGVDFEEPDTLHGIEQSGW